MSIFIQVASYRDPELVLTLKDAINKAKYPNDLKFGICWQYHPEDEFTKDQKNLLEDERMFVIDVDISKEPFLGTCWARNKIQQLYDNEDYTLQLDSHMRFINEWDVVLIEMLKDLQDSGYKKPLITTYATSYEPKNDPKGRLDEVWRMDFDRFCPEGWLATAPSTIPNHKELTKPVKARFYSAHFAFAQGKFVLEVPHDPEFYFHGEEPSIAVRAYTNGYDLFHPHKIVCWHEYTRAGKKRHWDDDNNWVLKNNKAHLKYRQLFGMDGLERVDFETYGLGSERTLDEYKVYSGIDIPNRKIQQYTKDRYLPPNPIYQDEDAYKSSFFLFFRHCLDLHISSFSETDYDFWVVSFENNDGTVVYRQDADKNEVEKLIELSKKDDGWVRLWREYKGDISDKAIVWPHSISKEWCDRIEIKIK